jgi:hypothetical protein
MSAKRKQPKAVSNSVETEKEKTQLSSKQFDVFGVTVPSEFVRLCSLYITRYPDCASNDDEKMWTRINMIARNKGESIANMDDDGHILADCLEMVLKTLYDNGQISIVHMTKQVRIIEKLRETSHHSTLSQSQNTPLMSNGKRTKTNEFDDPNLADYIVSGDESEASQFEYGDYQDDTQQTVMGTDYDDDEEEDDIVVDSDADIRYTPGLSPNNTPTPSRKRENQTAPKIKNNQKPAIYYPDEDSDGEHLDPPRDDIPAGYNYNGDICPDLPRLIIKSVGKTHYGVGKKPYGRADVKKTKGQKGPKPGDLGMYYTLLYF